MNIAAYKEEIKLKLSGEVVDLELEDEQLTAIINAAFREIQRYIDTTVLITVPFKKCIDLSEYKINSVVSIYRTQGYLTDDSNNAGMIDPMYASQWQLIAGVGNLYNFNDYVYNLGAWNTLLQTRNTLSTDLAFRYEPDTHQLYINVAADNPQNITVEYVPRYDNVDEVKSDYWIDIIMRMSIALAKTIVGRIRTKFKLNNSLWQIDGDTLIAEGNAELAELRAFLTQNTQLCYPID